VTEDVRRNGNEGIGKPGPLEHEFRGYWSRRITEERRLVYRTLENEVQAAACRSHNGA
jgi:toxin YoeB